MTDHDQKDQPTPAIDVSIVVPLYNEEESAAELYRQVAVVMDAQRARGQHYEAIFISDGSRDRTVQNMRAAAAGDERVTILELMRNFGQTAATAAGFDHARGKVIVPMDGDLQNDPADIPALVAKLDENGQDPGKWDIVSGWRKLRQDKLLSRRFPSIIANRLIKKLTWTTEIHDFGCSMKAYRRKVLEDVTIYGEMHRFLPAICKWRGARITEMVVNHRARQFGHSKYNLKRTFKVLLDLLTVKFLGDYLAKPIYFFGKVAAATFGICVLTMLVAILQKFGWLFAGEEGLSLNRNIFFLFSLQMFVVGVIFLMMGVLSELMVRIYYESQGRPPYKVRSAYRGSEEFDGEPARRLRRIERAA
jgi:glycosyltransferase involved in cell wall biosynthesis